MLESIFNRIDKIVSNGGGFAEVWGNLTIDANYYPTFSQDTQSLNDLLVSFNPLLALQISANSDSISIDEIEDYEGSQFVIVINKVNLTIVDDYSIQFFYDIESFEKWLKNLCPFKVLPYQKLKLIVNKLKTTSGGPNLLITGDMDDSFDHIEFILPDNSLLHEHVLIPNGRHLTFNVSEYLITFINQKKSKTKTLYFEYLLTYSAATLCSTFVNEFDGNTVTLQGIKRVKVPLYNDETKVSLKFVFLLKEVVEWIYHDNDSAKIDIRRKLFLDRVTLDINYEEPLLNELSLIAPNALDQAKERYNFVMLDRRDAYAKELTSLLKDLHSQAELYSSKLRSLLSSLTRDVLAGILLIGFTLFTKFTEIEVLTKYETLISVIFKGLAVYFVASAIMQMVNDISDVLLSKKELKHWSNCTSETIPKKEIEGHIRKTLIPRLVVSSIIYFLLIVLYGITAYTAWKFPMIWNNIFD